MRVDEFEVGSRLLGRHNTFQILASYPLGFNRFRCGSSAVLEGTTFSCTGSLQHSTFFDACPQPNVVHQRVCGGCTCSRFDQVADTGKHVRGMMGKMQLLSHVLPSETLQMTSWHLQFGPPLHCRLCSLLFLAFSMRGCRSLWHNVYFTACKTCSHPAAATLCIHSLQQKNPSSSSLSQSTVVSS